MTCVHTTFSFSIVCFLLLLSFSLQLGLCPLLFCDDETAKKKSENSVEVQLSPKENNDGSKLCKVERSPLGHDFHLDGFPQKHGTFISEVGTNT